MLLYGLQNQGSKPEVWMVLHGGTPSELVTLSAIFVTIFVTKMTDKVTSSLGVPPCSTIQISGLSPSSPTGKQESHTNSHQIKSTEGKQANTG